MEEIPEVRILLDLIHEYNALIAESISLIEDENPSTSNEALKIGEEIKLTLDYGETLKGVVVCGNFDWEQLDWLSRNYFFEEATLSKTNIYGDVKTVFLKLFHFDHSVKKEEVIEEMKKEKYKPAGLLELSALGVKYPLMELELNIIAINSFLAYKKDDLEELCCLYINKEARKVNITPINSEWSQEYCFLAVRDEVLDF